MTEDNGIIIKGVGGAYTVAAGTGTYTCTARGIFRKNRITPLAGDRVEINITDFTGKKGVLHTVLPRKNELTRPRVANMDQVIITMAAERPAFEPGLLDRFLMLAEHAGIPAVICINKCDLSKPEGEGFRVYTDAGYPTVITSYKTSEGLDKLRESMADKVSVFAGPSGVGKSSLINAVTGHESMETGDLSARINRGKHTTRHTELIPLYFGGYCADTPGFTSLDISAVPVEAYAALFREILPYIGRCRFTDCGHDRERDCAVKEQIGKAIHPLRYESYVHLYRSNKK